MEHLPATEPLATQTVGPLRITVSKQSAATLADCLFLGSLVLISLILYTGELGFYRDDWGFLRWLYAAPDQSVGSLYRALYSGDVVIRQRPAQVLMLALLYRLSGLNPLGYHLANAAVPLATVLLFCLVLRQLRQPRFLSVALPLVYLLLPHYSTDRFWIAAFQAPLSIALYLLSLYAGLRGQKNRTYFWQAISLTAALGSLLAYEVVLPFLLLNPFIIWYNNRLSGPQHPTRVQTAGVAALYYLALAAVIAYKLNVSVRVGLNDTLLAHLLNLALGALRVNYGTYGLGLPYVAIWVLTHRPDAVIITLAALTGILTFFYLLHLLPAAEWPGHRTWLSYIAIGLLIFILGYAVFLFNSDIWFTSAGQGNRVAIAAAVGVALSFIGGIGWLAGGLPGRARRPFFSMLVAALAAMGFLINNSLATYWAAAYQEQGRIVAGIQRQFPDFPAGTTLLVDGICPEVGPAPLFQSAKDLAGTLIIAYQDPTLYAIAIPPAVEVGETGLALQNAEGKDYGSYLYRDAFILYHEGEKRIYQLNDAASARHYFQAHIPHDACPPGFAWGWNE